MKTALFYTVLMLLAFGLKAQTLEIPQIISVSVDTVTGYPIVNWKLENPQETDGVVIKRLIIGGQGVISGTYNTVAQTNDNSVFSYCDSKEAYGTKPQAENRKEFYRVAAYKNKDGKPIYSLMSDEVSTQSFSGSFDYCTNTFNFEFSPNKEYGAKIMHYCLRTGFPLSKRLLITKDTVCSFSFDDFQEFRNFAIETVYSDNSSSFSPVITIKSEETIIPQKLEITSVSVNENEKLEIKYSVSEGSSADKIVLERLLKENQEVSSFEIPAESGVFTDTNAVISTVYHYSITALNSCGVPLKVSEPANNIVLKATQSETGNAVILNWNSPGYLQPQTASNTEIYCSSDGSDMEYLDDVSPYYTEYNESLSNIIAGSGTHEGNFCYKIKINTSGGDDFVVSNLACIDLETVIYIPNALNPKSMNYDNREFKPKADFLKDYKMAVYDKRGETVFFTEDLSKGWDGYNRQGKLCPPDTYIYQMSFKNSSGKKVCKNGIVNLVY